jgi:hypothetical protein
MVNKMGEPQPALFRGLHFSRDELAADSDTVYVTFIDSPQMEIYSTNGTFIETIPLVMSPSTLLGGYTPSNGYFGKSRVGNCVVRKD